METKNLDKLMAQATPGPWNDFVLDAPKNSIGQYVQQCVDASGGDEFMFVSAPHPDGGDADIAHVGNGPKGKANAKLVALFGTHGPALVAVLKQCVEAQNRIDGAVAQSMARQILVKIDQEATR